MKQRSSNFELMRLMLMVFIMMHHFIYAMPSSVVSSGLHAVDTLFHTAVIDFVLLSGFFGIKFKISGLFSLLLQVVFYSVLLTLMAFSIFGRCPIGDFIRSFMPFSNGFYWFIAIYLQLYLISPFLNIVLERLDNRSFFWLIAACCFLVFYLGLMRGGNVCEDGKNIVNFSFIYCVGHGLRRLDGFVQTSVKQVRILSLATIVGILAIVYIVGMFPSFGGHKLIMGMTYRYHSPGLLLLAICIFLLFQSMTFQSKTVNYLAVSALSLYLFHEHPLMKGFLYKDYFASLNVDGYILGGGIPYACGGLGACRVCD